MADGQRLGGGLAPKIAKTVADATVTTRSRTAKITHDLALKIQDSFFKIIGAEHRRTIGRLFSQVAENEELPPWARDTFHAIATEDGQGYRWLAQAVGGSVLGTGLGALLTNELGPAVQQIIATNPHGLIDPGTAAQMQARDIGGFRSPRLDARKQGVDTARFEAMVAANRPPIELGALMELWRRGSISRNEVEFHLKRAGYSDAAIDDLAKLRRVHLTPEQAASLENFGVINREQGREIANKAGVSDGDYDDLSLGAGIPPGTEELLAAFRRGIISESRLEKGITQSPIRREWFDVIKALRFSPPPSDIALSAATQNLLSPGEAKRVVSQNGTDPSAFDWMLESFGRPLSPEEAGRLFNRGVISRSQLRQMFFESTLKNKYVKYVEELAERLPTMEMTVRMVREGAMNKRQGIDAMMDLGFNRKNATFLIDLGVREKTKDVRDLSVSQIQELYGERAISKPKALDFLQGAGFDKKESEWVLSIIDMRRSRSIQNAAISRVRARFVTRRITETEAITALDRLAVLPDQRDDLIDAWNVERDVARPELTVSQIQQGIKAGLLTADAGFARLTDLGYSEEDATILTSLAIPKPRGTTAR